MLCLKKSSTVFVTVTKYFISSAQRLGTLFKNTTYVHKDMNFLNSNKFGVFFVYNM